MIILITGATHTGKTVLAQKLLEKTKYPYISIDHLKMGLIRSGNTELTPECSDQVLTKYLWPIVREMIKTAIENKQNLIIEGCYIPDDWKADFEDRYLASISYICLVMSEKYIKKHFIAIKEHANDIEDRLDDSYCSVDLLVRDNLKYLEMCKRSNLPYVLIDNEYEIKVNIDLLKTKEKKHGNN